MAAPTFLNINSQIIIVPQSINLILSDNRNKCLLLILYQKGNLTVFIRILAEVNWSYPLMTPNSLLIVLSQI